VPSRPASFPCYDICHLICFPCYGMPTWGVCWRTTTTTRACPYGDLVFEEVDWSEVGEHDPARRAERKGTSETDIATEWATEACQDPRRWVRSAGSASGLTVKVTGWSAMAGFIRDGDRRAKGSSAERSLVGATAWKAKASEGRQYEEGR
jgi:hypothetical protein